MELAKGEERRSAADIEDLAARVSPPGERTLLTTEGGVRVRREHWWNTPDRRRETLLGLLFVSPWLIGFLAWTLQPLFSSLYYSFTNYDLLRPPTFIGLENYRELFTDDPVFGRVLFNTLYYVLLGAPLGVCSAFLMALLLNTQMVGRPLFRALFFFPAIIPTIVTAVVWQFLLNPQFGAINSVLRGLGLPVIPFLTSEALAKPSLILVYMWAQGSAMVIFLAGLQDVPRDLYEAAMVDGAGPFRRFRYVTLPMMSPVILFNLIIGFIYTFQEFSLPWLLTSGGPGDSTELYGVYLYRNAFVYLRMGKASALAWILFIIIFMFTMALLKTSGRFVFYRSEEP